MSYDTGSHTVFYHRYHIVWITKYRYTVLKGALGLRIREIIRQVCKELGVNIVKGGISGDHVHMMISIPPPYAPHTFVISIQYGHELPSISCPDEVNVDLAVPVEYAGRFKFNPGLHGKCVRIEFLQYAQEIGVLFSAGRKDRALRSEVRCDFHHGHRGSSEA